MKIDSEFQERVKQHQGESRDSSRSVHLNRVVTTGIDGFYGKARARKFEFYSDEPSEGGGQNRAPRPLEYFLGGFAFCQQAQYAKHAALRGLDISGLTMDVKGYVDQRGVLGLDDVAAGFRNIDYTVKIQTSESNESIMDLVTTVESVCPAHAAIKGGTPLARTLIVNGEELT
jgi:uncharacterized OsmC-like protein